MAPYPILPDYSHGIINIPNSILREFGCTPHHATLAPLDDVLASKKYNHIVLLVCDAMGSINLNLLPDESEFLREHRIDSISSVFPPTTTAATTTLFTGLSPMQHGWIGWAPYIPSLGESVELYPNDVVDHLECADNAQVHAHLTHPMASCQFQVGTTLMPFTSVIDEINAAGTARTFETATYLAKDNPLYIKKFSTLTRNILSISASTDRTYTYAYWPQPDTAMHKTGITSAETSEEVASINKLLRELQQSLRTQHDAHSDYGDTLIIVTADHGHINSTNGCFDDYPQILDALTAAPSLEPRACTFFVKPECKSHFPELFYSYFNKKDFLLLPGDKIISDSLFGPVTADKPMHPLVPQMVGDFISIAVGEKSIFNSLEKAMKHKGAHAGLSKQELSVPLIIIEA